MSNASILIIHTEPVRPELGQPLLLADRLAEPQRNVKVKSVCTMLVQHLTPASSPCQHTYATMLRFGFARQYGITCQPFDHYNQPIFW